MQNINILVPIDFSDLSISALHSAETLANLFNGSVTPFHSYVPINEMDSPYMFNMGAGGMEDYEQMERQLHERLEEISKEEMEERLLSAPLIAMGNPSQAITEEAKNFDMIVMSTHGRTGFSRFFLGSVAEKVLRISHVPVLVVNMERELNQINNIVVTTDFSEHSKKALPLAMELTQKTGASLKLVHILSREPYDQEKPGDSIMSLREQRLNVLAKEELHEISDQLETTVISSTNTPHEAILNYSHNNPHDLIIMSTLGRTGIKYLMLGSTTANVVRHVKSPVLSINPKVSNE